MNGFYEDLGRLFRDRRLLFLNYGLAIEGRGGSSWVRREDRANRLFLALVRRTLEGVDLEGKGVLEVGCGRGGNCSYLCRYTDASEVVGLDQSEANIRLCRELHEGLAARFVRGDAEALPFESKCFDVVLNLESSHCYAGFDRFLQEAKRVLRPGGIFAWADFWGLNDFPWDWRTRERQIRRCGLELQVEYDVSRLVAKAIRHRAGISSVVEGCRTKRNGALLARILEANEVVRRALESGECQYRIARFKA